MSYPSHFEGRQRKGVSHTHISRQHHLFLPAIERELKLPLNYNPVVNGQGPVKRGFNPRGEVNQPDDAAVGDVDGRLDEGVS